MKRRTVRQSQEQKSGKLANTWLEFPSGLTPQRRRDAFMRCRTLKVELELAPLAMLAANRYHAIKGQAPSQLGGCQPPIETTEEKSMTRFFRRTRSAWLIVGVFAAALVGGVLSQSATRLFSTDEHPL